MSEEPILFSFDIKSIVVYKVPFTVLLYPFGREYVVPESQVQGHGEKPRSVFVNRDLGENLS
jgi:hypothetical protein